MEMRLLGERIPFEEDYVSIHKLKFLKDNPRVYAVTHGERDFDQFTEEEQQTLIFRKLKAEPSVTKLIPDVKRHGGLIEPILVRHDTQEVIEGNSRLAAYRILHYDQAEGDWDFIPCHIVTRLTPQQQAAFLNQIHVKGKTQWTAYEKANFAYVRREAGWTVDEIAELFGESARTIRTRITVIELMKNSEDNEKSHFSHYDVLVRNQQIWSKLKDPCPLRRRVIDEIKALDSEDPSVTAPDLRKKLPAIIRKPKVLRRYVDRVVDLDEGYLRAKVSSTEKRIKEAMSVLEISREEVANLDSNALNSLRQAVRKLVREVERIRRMVDEMGAS